MLDIERKRDIIKLQTISIQGGTMLKSKRKEIILSRLEQNKSVTLDELTSILETSESTVRRDLDELESEGFLKRVHGGAELPYSLGQELSNQEKAIKNVQKKLDIARQTAKLIAKQDVIFIDAGTTTELLIDFLPHEQLTVVTNSIHHAAKLVDRGIKTIIIGGAVKHSTDASIGQVAINQIRQITVDKAFLGMNGIDEVYLTTPDLEEAAIKEAIINNSQQTFILMDSSKLGQVTFAKVKEINDINLVTNKTDSELMTIIKEKMKVIQV